jgi:hypothetical protein
MQSRLPLLLVVPSTELHFLGRLAVPCFRNNSKRVEFLLVKLVEQISL